MARIDVIMPQMGESVTEGTIVRWIKRVGDRVDRVLDLLGVEPVHAATSPSLLRDEETLKLFE